jgi:hypothetical protein
VNELSGHEERDVVAVRAASFFAAKLDRCSLRVVHHAVVEALHAPAKRLESFE